MTKEKKFDPDLNLFKGSLVFWSAVSVIVISVVIILVTALS